MKVILRRSASIITAMLVALVSCKGGWDVRQRTIDGTGIDTVSTLKVVDSFTLKENVGGFDEYIPVALSADKRQLLIAPARGKKIVIVYDLLLRTVKDKIDFGKYLNQKDSREGIYNVALSGDNIYVTYRNEVLVYSLKENKLVNRFLTGKISGVYAAYNKQGTISITGKDTVLLSQLFSADKSKYNSEADAVIELSPLSLYSFSGQQYATCKLPSLSLFKDRNLGQSSVSFDYNDKKNRGIMAVSPDTLLYFFSLNNNKISEDSVWGIRHLFTSAIHGFERSNQAKDIISLTGQNPQITGLQLTDNGIFISYANGLDSSQLEQLYDYTLSTAQRGKLFAQYRKSYLMAIDSNMNCHGAIPLQENIESLALALDDTRFICKPKVSFYFNQDSIKFYIVKYER